MADSVRSHCQARKMRYVKDDAPTCLPATVLREMVKTFKSHAVSAEDREAFKPYASHGGRDGQSNHRTKAGLLRTVNQALNGLPEDAWIDPDVQPDNPYLQQLILRQPDQKESLVQTMQTRYFKPAINAGTDQQFRNTLLTTDQIFNAVMNATVHKKSFAFLGVARPVYSGTQELLVNLHKYWRIQSRGRHGQESARYKAFGVIWNTDPEEEGSHWVTALFYPFERRYEYFDSVGNHPTDAVGCQMKLVKQELARLAGFPNKDWRGQMNTTRHQRGGVQCGMYSIWFLVQRIVEKRSWLYIAQHPTHDSEVCAMRPDHFARLHSRVRRSVEERQRRLERELAAEDARIAASARKLAKKAKADVAQHNKKGTSFQEPIELEARRYASKPQKGSKKSALKDIRVRIRTVAGGKDLDAQDNHIFKESTCPRVEIQRLE